jgi:hypothetical protein
MMYVGGRAMFVAAMLAVAARPARADPAAAGACPVNQTLKLDLAAWKAQVLAAADLKTLLAALKRAELPSGPSVDFSFEDDENLDGPIAVDDFRARLSSGVFDDEVIQVRFKTKEDQLGGQLAAWVQVLEPAGAGSWCALGADLTSTIHRHDSEACTDKPGTVFQFVSLLDPTLKAIRATSRAGSCYGSDRGEETVVRFWAIVGRRLVKVLDRLILSSSWYRSSNPDIGEQIAATITLKGGFPKQIEHWTRTTGAREESQKPKTTTETVVYVFDGSKYVGTPRPPRKRGRRP